MDIEHFFDTFSLHDSSIIEFRDTSLSHNNIYFKITLCNWMQDFYKDGDPEFLMGELIFNEVSNLSFAYSESDDFIGGDQYDWGIIFAGIKDQYIEFVIQVDDFSKVKETPITPDINVLRFKAREVIWKPIPEVK